MKKEGQTIVVYIISKAMFFGLGTSFIIGNAKQNSWLAIIIGYLLGLLILHFLMQKRLDLITHNIVGKIVYNILILAILIVSILAFSVQTINFYLPETPTIIISYTFLFIICYGASKGFKGFKRLCEFLVFIGLILTILGAVGNIKNIDFNNFMPMFYHLDINFFIAIIATTVFSLAPVVLLLCIRSEYDKKSVYIGYILGGLNSLLVVISTVGTLGVILSSKYRYPEYIAFKKISMFNIIERVENILSYVWLIDTTILGILCVISLTKCFNNKGAYIISFIYTCITTHYFIDIYQNTLIIYKDTIYLLLALIIIIYLASKKESKLIDSNS